MKKKILHLCGFLILIGVLCTSFIITKPIKQVSADTTLYYFEVDTSHESYMVIILYVYDVANLENDECNFNRLLSGKTPSYASYEAINGSFGTAQFVRNRNLDYNDYDAYVFSYNYPVDTAYTTALFWLHSGDVLKLDSNVLISYDLYIPYPPALKASYDSGYQDGYDDGEEDATEERNAYWEQYIDDEYIDPQGPGYQLIYQRGRSDGFSAGQQSLDTMTWFQTITSGVSNIFSLQLLPSITIGALIFIPLMFMILSGVLWIWRKK